MLVNSAGGEDLDDYEAFWARVLPDPAAHGFKRVEDQSNSRRTDAEAANAGSPVKLFRQGFITSSANPFAVMFFAVLFPQFINPEVSTLPQLAILGVTYLLVDGVILLAWG